MFGQVALMCLRRNLILGLAAGIGVFTSLLVLKFVPVPFAWIAFLWVMICLAAFNLSASTNRRAIFVNLAVVILVMGGAELYFWMIERPNKSASIDRIEGSYTEAYVDQDNEVLGYAPFKNISANARKYHGEELVYDVIYRINSDGLRRSPPVKPGRRAECLLFFGGSFTIGEGVNDHETLPYRVGAITQGQYRVYNFGFHGYGPHQMLAALESGTVSRIIDCIPKYVIYSALDRHVLRSSGQVSWGKNSPRYVLDSRGTVFRNGTFEDQKVAERILPTFARQIRKSYIFRRISGRSASNRVTEQQLRTFGAIVDASRGHALKLNSDAKFHVLLWNFDELLTRRVVGELESREVELHTVLGTILPEAPYKETYALGAHDHHPSAMTYDLVARYVAELILKEPQTLAVSALPDSQPAKE